MTKPEPVYPGTCTLATRRTLDRTHYLLPDEQGRNAYLYATGLALKKSGLNLVVACQMSNHLHEVLADPHGRRTLFLEARNGLLSRSINALRGRQGYLLQPPSRKDKILLADARQTLNAIIYTLVNPVEAGLVDWPDEWPGTVGDWRNILTTPCVATKPDFFYKQGPKSELPDAVSFTLVMPPVFAQLGYSKAQYEALVREGVEARCLKIHAERTRPALGPKKALAISPFDKPSTASEGDHEALDKRRFRGDPRLQELLLALWLSFLEAYNRARNRSLRGEQADFPFGTDRYRHKEQASVEIKPPKSAAYLFT